MCFAPKTRYVLGQVAGLDISNQNHVRYIEDLKFIECIVEQGVCGSTVGQAFSAAIARYPAAYLQIIRELKPGEYRKLLRPS